MLEWDTILKGVVISEAALTIAVVLWFLVVLTYELLKKRC